MKLIALSLILSSMNPVTANANEPIEALEKSGSAIICEDNWNGFSSGRATLVAERLNAKLIDLTLKNRNIPLKIVSHTLGTTPSRDIYGCIVVEKP